MEGEQNIICIKYINDLELEIKILENIKQSKKNNDLEINKEILNKKKLLEECKINLSKLSNNQICYRLYLHILNGMSPSKAIEKISQENMINGIKPTDTSTLWKNYYKKIKKYL